jgi:hypothetical protein
VRLRIISPDPYRVLVEDDEWNAFLDANPDIEEIG